MSPGATCTETRLGSLGWRGNDPGYPYGVQIDAKTLQLNYRGSAAVCMFWKGCGPTKHPWVRIMFYADNTLNKEWGVA